MSFSIHIDDELAKQFIKKRPGEKVSFSVSGEIREIGLRPDFSKIKGGFSPEKEEKAPKKPHVTIEVSSIDGVKSGKSAKDMTDKEIEAEAAKVKENG